MPEPFINLIMGPMFSGKTTKLINSYNAFVNTHGKEKCIIINYTHDKRYTKEPKVVSHDGLNVDCYDTCDLAEFIDNPLTQPIFLKAKYIFINEAQFFPNLIHLIIFSKNILNKNFVLCGLDYDYKKEKFGDLLDLVPYANNVYNLTGKCNTPYCLYPSKYSHRAPHAPLCPTGRPRAKPQLPDLLEWMASEGIARDGLAEATRRPPQVAHHVINSKKQILIGITQYVPLCEHCYANANKEKIESSL
tara:strand:- start:7787 stop:8527 length:741 start_codon:yes stop_codon:yes gene_type:complete